eukprot:COSAG01_NODE_140_length_24259_cov_41.225096_11_plen_145_part_00
MKQFEREQRRDDLERRHANLAKAYPTLFGGGAGDKDAAPEEAGGVHTVTGDDGLGARNLFKREFGHLSEASQYRFKADSLWMGQAEGVLRQVGLARTCLLTLRCACRRLWWVSCCAITCCMLIFAGATRLRGFARSCAMGCRKV